MYLWNYHLSTGAGEGVGAMMKALYEQRVCSYHSGLIPERENPIKNIFLGSWETSLRTILANDQDLRGHFSNPSSRWGLILATTKGHIEDYIWNETGDHSPAPEDPGAHLLRSLTLGAWASLRREHALSPEAPLCASISQACASSHIAFQVAKSWLDWNWVDFVVVLAGDIIGPFVSKGFASLKLMASTKQKPFDQTRDGLFLGDAVGCAIVGKEAPRRSSWRFNGFANDTEGSVTRPSLNGDSLFSVLNQLGSPERRPQPDLIVAHGTATRFNDLAEDRALSQYFQRREMAPVPITGTKWCVGHCLGASGLVDIVATAEILRQQKPFVFATSEHLDPQLKLKTYLLNNGDYTKTVLGSESSYREALVTSLGFGGVHAACWLERVVGLENN